MDQLNFSFERDDHALQDYLNKATGRKISLVITDNSTSMLSMRFNRDTVMLRLHRMFLAGGNDLLDELAEFIGNKRKRTPLVSKYISRNTHTIKKRTPKKLNLQPVGRYHDLSEIYDNINREYFSGRVSAAITWSERRPARAAARRTLGSFSSYSNTIRISPALDSKRVPRYYVEFIVYHEMLHADIGIDNGAKRRVLHSKEFRRREKLFHHYERAITWETRN